MAATPKIGTIYRWAWEARPAQNGQMLIGEFAVNSEPDAQGRVRVVPRDVAERGITAEHHFASPAHLYDTKAEAYRAAAWRTRCQANEMLMRAEKYERIAAESES